MSQTPPRDRSFRRHHVERLKATRRGYLSNLVDRHAAEYGQRWAAKVLRQLTRTPHRCSCYACGNPRRHFGDVTLQERRADLCKKETR